jgi:hypothetical protein
MQVFTFRLLAISFVMMLGITSKQSCAVGQTINKF